MTGSQSSPPTKVGVSDYDQLVGDYTNPILQPWAAQVVKKFGEISLAGITYREPVEPVLACPDAVHLQASPDEDDTAAGQGHDDIQWRP